MMTHKVEETNKAGVKTSKWVKQHVNKDVQATLPIKHYDVESFGKNIGSHSRMYHPEKMATQKTTRARTKTELKIAQHNQQRQNERIK